jgi:prepilin-type N-terminal cleavage/methylation domain-containing protein
MKTLDTRRLRGFTLVEVLITAFVIGTAFVAATWSMTATARTKAAYDAASSPAGFLAQEIFNLADGLPRTPSGTIGVTSGGAVAALDSLEGASFSPPILSDGTLAPGLAGWRQSVDLSIYSLDNLVTPCNLDPADGLPAESSYVYRLEVTIKQDGKLVDTFSWWLRP